MISVYIPVVASSVRVNVIPSNSVFWAREGGLHGSVREGRSHTALLFALGRARPRPREKWNIETITINGRDHFGDESRLRYDQEVY